MISEKLNFKLDNLQLFAEEEPNSDVPKNAEEYVEAIKNIKKNTVPKSDYDKLVQEHQTLIKGIAEGVAFPPSEKEEKKKPDIKELRKKILTAGENNMSNAEFVQTALDLRNACLEEKLPDPFLPLGIKNKPDNTDLEGAQKVADAFQTMLDESRDEEGKVDNDFFNALLKKYIANDSSILVAKLNANRPRKK